LLPKNWGAPAIFEKQIEIKLLHPASTEEVTDSGDREGRQERVKASYVFERRSNARGKGTDD
jgi:hypothetical protein